MREVMNPLISICMPNYNYGTYIKEAIESILSQTYSNFELIIVDDASTDNSAEIIKSFNDPRIKLHRNPSNIFMFPTINKAIKQAKGEIIAVIHSDDLYEKTFLEEIVKSYNEYPDKKVFITGVNFYHSESNYKIPWHPYKSGGIKSQKEVLLILANYNNIGNGVNVAIHKDCIDKVGFFTETYKYIGDFDYWLRLAEEYDFVYIPKILANYRIHDSNITHSLVKDMIFFREGYEVFNKNISESKIIDNRIYKRVLYIGRKKIIHTAFRTGIKYKSGKILRGILRFSREVHSDIFFEPYWYLIYLFSFFIQENMSYKSLNFISFLARLIFYPQKIYINFLIDKLIAQETANSR
jgi:glycosyltransferase involved in cell wall biosynthesis